MTKSQTRMWHQICWVQSKSALPTATQRRNAQNMARTAARRYTRIVTDNACGIVAKTFVLTTVAVLPLASQQKSRRRGLHLHHLRLDQAFALGLPITRATRPGNRSAAAITAVVTVQAMIPCATTIPRDTWDGTTVHINQISIATLTAVVHLAAS
jgi:hypothetical protein